MDEVKRELTREELLELLRCREAEINELRHYIGRLESDSRVLQEAIVYMSLERVGIKKEL